MPVVRHVKRLSVAEKKPLRAEEIQAAIDAEYAERQSRQPVPVVKAVKAEPTHENQPAPAGKEKE